KQTTATYREIEQRFYCVSNRVFCPAARSGSDCLTHHPLTLEFVAVFSLELCRILLQHRQQALGSDGLLQIETRVVGVQDSSPSTSSGLHRGIHLFARVREIVYDDLCLRAGGFSNNIDFARKALVREGSYFPARFVFSYGHNSRYGALCNQRHDCRQLVAP